MKILKMLENPKYLIMSIAITLVFAAIYVYTQVLGIVQNLDVWFTNIQPVNLFLLIIISLLFGMTTSFQIFIRQQSKTCPINKKAIGTGSIGTFTSFMVAQCPACASLGALILPSSIFLAVFVKYTAVINLISIALLIFTINYLGGFQK